MLNSQMNNSCISNGSPVNSWLDNRISIGKAFECEMDNMTVTFETVVNSHANLDL